MRLQTGSRLLFIGDSITDCGRARPIGKNGSSDALGNGYVSLISSALTSGYPDYDLEILNTGISGNTVLDLKYRWKRDVLELEPDWLSVMIGINDVWGNFSLLGTFGNTISDQVYTKTLTELIQQVRPDLQGLILMTSESTRANTSLDGPLRGDSQGCCKEGRRNHGGYTSPFRSGYEVDQSAATGR
jgi:lysophospholipase L1-like esterase